MQTSEVLNKAADEIERRGWTQGPVGWGHHEDVPAGVCLEGGILAALGLKWGNGLKINEFYTCPSYSAVLSYLGDQVNECRELWSWNDEHGRTAGEVIEVLRACAVIEEARERQAVEVEA